MSSKKIMFFLNMGNFGPNLVPYLASGLELTYSTVELRAFLEVLKKLKNCNQNTFLVSQASPLKRKGAAESKRKSQNTQFAFSFCKIKKENTVEK